MVRVNSCALSLISNEETISLAVGGGQVVLQFGVGLVEIILGLLGRYALFERLNGVELANRIIVEGVDALEGLLPEGLLVVGQEQPSELLPLEEVLPVVLWLGL